jgi:HSP20 family protein
MVKRIKPVSRIVKIEAEINRIIGKALLQKSELLSLDESWVPFIDIAETSDQIIVKVELPGVDHKDISLLLHSSRLEIKGKKIDPLASKGARFLRLEREYGTFRRIVLLPNAVLTEGAKAVIENGVLTIVMKKYTQKIEDEIVVKVKKGGE